MGTAIVTGASAGLGLEFARLFVKDGHQVVLVARRQEQLEAVAKALKTEFPNSKAHVIGMDLALPGAGKRLWERTEALNLKIDFLVNNAGFGDCGNFSELSLSRQLQMIDLNVRTLVELAHLYLPSMRANRSGRILNVGSTAGFQPGPYMATYFATKAFVNSFSEALNEELKGTGVTCTVLAPGATATEFQQNAHLDKALLFKTGVAKSAPVVLAGYRGMMKGRSLVVPGFKNKAMIQLLRISPRALVLKMVSRLNR